MLDVTKVPVAKTVAVSRNNRGELFTEEAFSTVTIPTTSFLEQVYPEQKIEHVGRPSMINVSKAADHDYPPAPASLFFQTIHRAFDKHYAIGLRPEVLMYLITSVVAETVRRYPDEYRNVFTISDEKVDIHIRHDGLRLGDQNSPWDEAIEMFDAAMRPHVPSEIMDEMMPGFSSADRWADVVSLVSFMDAASPFYDYHVHTRCGIPRIVLFGETTDYEKLVQSAQQLSERFDTHLGEYFEHLIPVLEKIAYEAASDSCDEDFWGAIYKKHSGSGGERFSGWLTAFLWYVHEYNWKTEASPLVVKDERLINWHDIASYDGVDCGSEPAHVSQVPFMWHYFNEDLPMNFVGGVMGVENTENALTPVLNYGVIHAPKTAEQAAA